MECPQWSPRYPEMEDGDGDSERQDHSGVCQVTGVTGGVFAQNEQGSNCVVDIPSECVVPGTETSTMFMVNNP